MTAAMIKALEPLTSRVRTDVTCKKESATRMGWTKEPLTDALMAEHLNGGPARGCAHIKQGDSTTRAATLDFDSHKGETSWADMTAAAESVTTALEEAGLAPTPFSSSGGKGIHLIMLWDAPQDAYSVRKYLAQVLESVNFKDGAAGVSKGEIEIFPKQDSVAAGKHGNQCILPLAGQSVPLEPMLGLARMPKDHVTKLVWPMSNDVPLTAKPLRVAAVSVPIDLAKLSAALDAIPNDGEHELGYDKWRDVIFGIHHATGGSNEGLELAHTFSQKSIKHDPGFLDQKFWPYIKDRDGGITSKTIMMMARGAGWNGCPDDTFEVIAQTPGEPLPLPAFKRDGNGAVDASMSNLAAALARPDVCGQQLRHDTFREEIMLAAPETDGWRALKDTDYTQIRITLESQVRFKEIGKEKIRDAVNYVADKNGFDSAQHWLNSLTWDGAPRVDAAMITYFGAADTAYSRAIGLYLWTALAGRVLVPGIKADMVPCAVGAQGLMKSSTIEAMSPSAEFFLELDLNGKEDDIARLMCGKLVIELGELKGMSGKDADHIKAFIVKKYEKWIPKYRENSTQYARRSIFFGSTNQREFLKDETGNRRWLPFDAGACNPDGMARDRDQLWAEGAYLYRAEGIRYQAAEKLAELEHARFTVCDPWEEIVSDWLEGVDALTGDQRKDKPFTAVSALACAVQMEPRSITQGAKNRMAQVLKALGYTAKNGRINGKGHRVYVKTE